jgi:hypothetical protein
VGIVDWFCSSLVLITLWWPTRILLRWRDGADLYESNPGVMPKRRGEVHLTIDEVIERGRRAKLHKEIGALTRELTNMGHLYTESDRRKFYRLDALIKRKQRELVQSRMSVAS